MTLSSLCPDLDQSTMQPFDIYHTTASILSLIASLAVTISYAFLPNLKNNQNFRYIGYLSLSNVALAIFFVIQLPYDLHVLNPPPMPVVLRFLLNYSQGLVMYWVIVFAFNVYNIIINTPGNWTSWASNEKKCLIAGFILPIPYGVAIVWSGVGEITSKDASILTAAIEGATLLVLLFIYTKTVMKAKELMKHESATRVIVQTIGFSGILIVNLIGYLSSSLVYEMHGCSNLTYFWLRGLWYLQGFVDAVVYGANSVFRRELRAVCCRGRANVDMFNVRLAD